MLYTKSCALHLVEGPCRQEVRDAALKHKVYNPDLLPSLAAHLLTAFYIITSVSLLIQQYSSATYLVYIN